MVTSSAKDPESDMLGPTPDPAPNAPRAGKAAHDHDPDEAALIAKLFSDSPLGHMFRAPASALRAELQQALQGVPPMSDSDTPYEQRLVYAHLFSPRGRWFVCEYDPQDGMCFGWAHTGWAEMGYISIATLNEAEVEADLSWTVVPLGQALRDRNLDLYGP